MFFFTSSSKGKLSLSPKSNLISALFANANANRKWFSFWMSLETNAGKLFIGEEDEKSLQKYYSGNLSYVNVTSSSSDKWQFKIESIEIPGLTMCTNCTASISTGFIAIYGPTDAIVEFNKKIGAIDLLSDTNQKLIPCGQVPNLPSWSFFFTSFFLKLKNILFFLKTKDITFFINDQVKIVLTGKDYTYRFLGSCLISLINSENNETGNRHTSLYILLFFILLYYYLHRLDYWF